MAALFLCLASYLVEFSDYKYYALCPASTNCLCLSNITTRVQFIAKCVDLELLEEYCPSSDVSLQCLIHYLSVFSPGYKVFSTLTK